MLGWRQGKVPIAWHPASTMFICSATCLNSSCWISLHSSRKMRFTSLNEKLGIFLFFSICSVFFCIGYTCPPILLLKPYYIISRIFSPYFDLQCSDSLSLFCFGLEISILGYCKCILFLCAFDTSCCVFHACNVSSVT